MRQHHGLLSRVPRSVRGGRCAGWAASVAAAAAGGARAAAGTDTGSIDVLVKAGSVVITIIILTIT